MTEPTNDQVLARIEKLEANLGAAYTRLAGTQAALMIVANHFAADGGDSAMLSLELMTFQREHGDGLPKEYFEAFDAIREQLASRY